MLQGTIMHYPGEDKDNQEPSAGIASRDLNK